MNEYHAHHTSMQLNSLTTKLEEKLDIAFELNYSFPSIDTCTAHLHVAVGFLLQSHCKSRANFVSIVIENGS